VNGRGAEPDVGTQVFDLKQRCHVSPFLPWRRCSRTSTASCRPSPMKIAAANSTDDAAARRMRRKD
jgi:hypothetical protein